MRTFRARSSASDRPVRAAAARKIGLNKKLYVGNLPFSTTEEDLKELFGQHGEVTSAKVITDRETGRSRGFAFVEMDANGATEAMRALDGNQFGGRPLRVNEAQERERGGGGGGGRGGPRGGGGGGRY